MSLSILVFCNGCVAFIYILLHLVIVMSILLNILGLKHLNLVNSNAKSKSFCLIFTTCYEIIIISYGFQPALQSSVVATPQDPRSRQASIDEQTRDKRGQARWVSGAVHYVGFTLPLCFWRPLERQFLLGMFRLAFCSKLKYFVLIDHILSETICLFFALFSNIYHKIKYLAQNLYDLYSSSLTLNYWCPMTIL